MQQPEEAIILEPIIHPESQTEITSAETPEEITQTIQAIVWNTYTQIRTINSDPIAEWGSPAYTELMAKTPISKEHIEHNYPTIFSLLLQSLEQIPEANNHNNWLFQITTRFMTPTIWIDFQFKEDHQPYTPKRDIYFELKNNSLQVFTTHEHHLSTLIPPALTLETYQQFAQEVKSLIESIDHQNQRESAILQYSENYFRLLAAQNYNFPTAPLDDYTSGGIYVNNQLETLVTFQKISYKFPLLTAAIQELSSELAAPSSHQVTQTKAPELNAESVLRAITVQHKAAENQAPAYSQIILDFLDGATFKTFGISTKWGKLKAVYYDTYTKQPRIQTNYSPTLIENGHNLMQELSQLTLSLLSPEPLFHQKYPDLYHLLKSKLISLSPNQDTISNLYLSLSQAQSFEQIIEIYQKLNSSHQPTFTPETIDLTNLNTLNSFLQKASFIDTYLCINHMIINLFDTELLNLISQANTPDTHAPAFQTLLLIESFQNENQIAQNIEDEWEEVLYG